MILEKLPPLPKEAIKQFDEAKKQDVNWKKVLEVSLCVLSDTRKAADMGWRDTLIHLRTTCPETEWLSIYDSHKNFLSFEEMSAFTSWMNSFIVSPDWIFPEKAILQTNFSQNHKSITLFIPQKTSVFYHPTPDMFLALPFKNEYGAGLKISFERSYTILKAGET